MFKRIQNTLKRTQNAEKILDLYSDFPFVQLDVQRRNGILLGDNLITCTDLLHFPPEKKSLAQNKNRGEVSMVDVLLDPEAAFERSAAHWRRCKQCRRAGMEWAKLKNLCARGRELLLEWDRVEAIYAGTEENAA